KKKRLVIVDKRCSYLERACRSRLITGPNYTALKQIKLCIGEPYFSKMKSKQKSFVRLMALPCATV
ncbi:hypothetical protein ACU95H_003926, partial [Acinetobacter baumannii]